MLDRLIKRVTSRFNLEYAAVATTLRGLLTLMTDERVGGVNELVAKFRTAGLGHLVESWIATGPNEALTPSQTRTVLGNAAMYEIADSAGIGRGAVVPVLGFMIPLLFDAITPDGVLPTPGKLRAETSRFLRGDPQSARADRSRSGRTSRAGRTRRSSRTSRADRRAGADSVVGGGLLRLAAFVIPVIALAGAWFYLQTGAGIDPILAVSNAGDEVTYTAHVRDEAARTTIIDALNSTFGEVRVKGDVSVDGGVKEAEWMPQVGDLLSALDTPGAELTLTGDSARVGGWLTDSERSSVAARVRGALGQNIAVSEAGEDRRAEALGTANARATTALAALDSLEPGEIRPEDLVAALNLSVIDFESGSAAIPASASGVIRGAARALRLAPPGMRIAVAGHTDAAGDSAADLTLSEERANSVVKALVAEGVEPGMLTAVGYGATRPIVSGTSEAARFRNQRIEYAVDE